MPGVCCIIASNPGVIPNGTPKNQATLVTSYGSTTTAQTWTAHRPQRRAAAGSDHRRPGRSHRPQWRHEYRPRHRYPSAVNAQSRPPRNITIRLIRCQYRMSPKLWSPGTPVTANTSSNGENATIASNE